jgi:glycerophosphoryl diester phosphodiesterase
MSIRPLVVAHRGVRSNGHTNTLDAFERAIRIGADMLELDIRRSADHTLVVHHDPTIGDRLLSTMELAEAVRCAAVLGYRMPTLADLFQLASGRVRLDLELKESGCEEAVLGLAFEHRCRVSDILITSFDANTLARVSDLCPGVRTGFLIDEGDRIVDRFHDSKASVLAPHYRLLNELTWQQVDEMGIEVLPWTVNELDTMRDLMRRPRVWGVITDEAAGALRLRRTLEASVTRTESRSS